MAKILKSSKSHAHYSRLDALDACLNSALSTIVYMMYDVRLVVLVRLTVLATCMTTTRADNICQQTDLTEAPNNKLLGYV